MHIDDFFQKIPQRLDPLFQDIENIWDPLDRLKEFIQDTIRPNLPDFISPGVPLPEHIVLLPNGWLTVGFEILCNSSTKGRLQVWIDGEPVPKASLLCAGSVFADLNIEVAEGVTIEPGALIKGPTIIESATEVRQGAYVRGDCIFGEKCVVGHTTEVKHSIFLDNAKAGHFAYIGDSILGNNVNLGAGTKMANLKFGPGTVTINIDGQKVDTSRRKIGAILGDNVQTGCNSVTNPGAFVGRDCLIPPTTSVMPGFYKPNSIIRS